MEREVHVLCAKSGLMGVTLTWCGMIGLFVLVLGCLIYPSWDAKTRFRTIPGVVLSSQIDVMDDGDGPSYAPRIRYRYRVNDIDYQSDRYSSHEIYSGGHARVGRTVKDYPPGRAVTVYYDPRKPSVALLRPGFTADQYFLLLFFVLLFFVPTLLMALAVLWRRFRGHQASVDYKEVDYKAFVDYKASDDYRKTRFWGQS